MPAWRGTRPLKRWRYVGVYTPELMLCVGDARIAGVPQRWWAVALPDGTLAERTTIRRRRREHRGLPRARGCARVWRSSSSWRRAIAVEVVSAAGESYVWTAKQAAIPVRGFATVGASAPESTPTPRSSTTPRATTSPHRLEVVGRCGPHRRRPPRGLESRDRAARLPSPQASAPCGSTASPTRSRLRSSPTTSPRSATCASPSGRRARRTRTSIVMRSRYRQPFGTFEGELPGGLALAEGCGVMEEHDVYW